MRLPPAAALLALGVAASASALGDTAKAPLTVVVTGLRSAKGKVGCTLFAGPRGFPSDPDAAVQRLWCKIDRASSTCPFQPVPAGTYAVACFHDENDNGKIDTGLFGIPTEGTVVSNHAKGTFGPPKYRDAKFAFSAEPMTMTLRMGY